MKQVKGKNLHDFEGYLRSHAGTVCSFSDGDYEVLSQHISQRRSAFIPGSGLLVGLNPQIAHSHKIVRRARTVLGTLPETLLSGLKLEHAVTATICANLSPWCSCCQDVARTPPSRALPALPDQEGLIALVVAARGPLEISLQEWCELLGAERAYCGDRIVSVSELSGVEVGEPVLRVFSAQERDAVQSEVDRWFGAAGGELVVYHLAARDAPMREVARLRPRARCEGCGEEVAIPTLAELAALPDCPQCRGEGWLENRSGRLEACGECDGYGSHADVTKACCGEISLRHAACLSFAEVLNLVAAEGSQVSVSERAQLATVCDSPFAEFAIGTPLASLSAQERALLTALVARLSGLHDLLLVGEGLAPVLSDPSLGGDSSRQLVGVAPEWLAATGAVSAHTLFDSRTSVSSPPSQGEIRLTDCFWGRLALDAVSLPIGRAVIVRCDAGQAAQELLDEVTARFKKRRKLAATTAFGTLKECHVFAGHLEREQTVLELLGLAASVGVEIARTQAAKLAGLSAEECTVGTGARRCVACTGVGIADAGEPCVLCGGSGLSAQVCGVSFGAGTYGDLFTLTLRELQGRLWMNDSVVEILSLLPDTVATSVTAGTRISTLSSENARFVALFGVLAGGLVGTTEGKGRRKKECFLAGSLFILKDPFQLTRAHQQCVFALLDQVLAAGATVFAAGVPQPLEKWFASVLELPTVKRSAAEAARDRYLDSRFLRRTVQNAQLESRS